MYLVSVAFALRGLDFNG